MSARRHNPQNQEEILFAQALPLSPARRRTYLDRACGGDARLRRRVEALLQAHAQAGDLLTPPARRPFTQTQPLNP